MELVLFIKRLINPLQHLKDNLNKNLLGLLSIRIGLSFIFSFIFFQNYLLAIFSIGLLFFISPKGDLLIFFLLGILYIYLFPLHEPLEQSFNGTAFCEIESIEKKSNQVFYKGKMKAYQTASKVHFCDAWLSFTLSKKDPLLKKGTYTLTGYYQPKTASFVVLKKLTHMTLQKESSGLKKLRSHFFEKIKKFRLRCSLNNQGENLLMALLLGIPPTKEIKNLFSKLGLSHLLAISGFHFSLIAACFLRFFNLLLPKKIVLIGLLFWITIYLFVVGTSSSILRAYFMIFLGILAQLFQKKSTGMNTLFIAFLFIFLMDPFRLEQIGFQLSFFATFGLLTFYSPLLNLLDLSLPKRSFFEARQLNHLNQYAYIFLQILKNILAINLAAILPTIFLILYYFKTISILSFIYNLVIPTLIGFGMTTGLFGLILSYIFHFDFLYRLTSDFLTELIITLNYYPRHFDYPINVENFSFLSLFLIQSTLLFIGLAVGGQKESKIETLLLAKR